MQGIIVNDGHPIMVGYNYGDTINGSFLDSQYVSAEVADADHRLRSYRGIDFVYTLAEGEGR
ncbi:hypothetical protein LCGC14_1436530 [marine sediment metagenome]|uniref:Uncharacterized protein n=1 Tax=marine sediment metagenome TaxID=412755 RepID=A0A0F9MNW5_9ZZZZ